MEILDHGVERELLRRLRQLSRQPVGGGRLGSCQLSGQSSLTGVLDMRKLPQRHVLQFPCFGREHGPGRDGHIEAIARSPIMGFREDVAIRIAPDGALDSRIDIRSSSRYFESDLGSNAARVTKFIEDLSAAAEADAQKPAKKIAAPPPKAPPAKTVKK